LDDEARSVVELLLELNQRFLWIDLVVEGEQLDFLPVHPAGSVDGIDVELVRLLRQDAGGRGTPREGVDKGDLDVGRCGSCQKRSDQQQTRGGTCACTHGSPPSFGGEVAARVASQQSALRLPVE